MKIAIVGTGYVGLVTGTCFAEMGVEVFCVDIDRQKIENLRNGVVPIYEPGLEEMVIRNYEVGRLHFTTDLTEVLDQVEIVFSAVGTPPDEDGSADLKYVLDVARTIGRAIDFDIASNPEFLKEGAAVKDFMHPDRIVVGVESDRARRLMEKLYHPFMLNNFRIIYMDIPSAEMTKYAANAMLATRISFMNEIAGICEHLGVDVENVRLGIGSDPRIGSRFIHPGAGYGGSCFPKDVRALVSMAESTGYEPHVLHAVETRNHRRVGAGLQTRHRRHARSAEHRPHRSAA